MIHDIEEPIRAHRIAHDGRELSKSFRSAGLREVNQRKLGPFHCRVR